MKDLLPDQKDSLAMFKPVGDVVRYGSGYIRVHVQEKIQKSHSHCTGEKPQDTYKNKMKQ